MSSNTPEQKRAHKAHQYFRDLLKVLKTTGICDWPYKGSVYRVILDAKKAAGPRIWDQYYNALVRYPRKRGFKITPVALGERGNKWIIDTSPWQPQDKDILGWIVGEVSGPKMKLTAGDKSND